MTCLRQWVPKLKEGGFTDLVFEDPLEMLIDQLNSLGQSDSLTVASLEENFRDDMVRFCTDKIQISALCAENEIRQAIIVFSFSVLDFT